MLLIQNPQKLSVGNVALTHCCSHSVGLSPRQRFQLHTWGCDSSSQKKRNVFCCVMSDDYFSLFTTELSSWWNMNPFSFANLKQSVVELYIKRKKKTISITYSSTNAQRMNKAIWIWAIVFRSEQQTTFVDATWIKLVLLIYSYSSIRCIYQGCLVRTRRGFLFQLRASSLLRSPSFRAWLHIAPIGCYC